MGVQFGGEHIGFDDAVFAVFAAIDDGEFVGVLIVEGDEGAVAEGEVDDGFIRVERKQAVGFGVNVGVFDVIFLSVEGFLAVDFFFEGFDAAIFARAMAFEHAGFEFAHAAGDLGDRFVDGGVDVVGAGVDFDDDVIGAEEDDFGALDALLDIEDDLGFHDARVIEVEAFDFLQGVVTHGFGDVDMTTGDDDG